jgi:hypothetical protein
MIVGYWSFFFVSDETVDRIHAGTLYESALTEKDIVALSGPMNRSIFVSMLAVHPAFDSEKAIKTLLYKSMMVAIDEMKSDGIGITSVYASAFTKAGRNKGRKLGLDVIGIEHGGRPILAGKWDEEMRRKLAVELERSSRWT